MLSMRAVYDFIKVSRRSYHRLQTQSICFADVTLAIFVLSCYYFERTIKTLVTNCKENSANN